MREVSEFGLDRQGGGVVTSNSNSSKSRKYDLKRAEASLQLIWKPYQPKPHQHKPYQHKPNPTLSPFFQPLTILRPSSGLKGAWPNVFQFPDNRNFAMALVKNHFDVLPLLAF
jgi:hypothetical protein